ncbi:MAG: cyclic nucleotide-binding domain-containing protein [Bdellovibrionota bacterium]
MAEPKETVIGAGQEIFRQGEKGGELFFIKSGEVELWVRDEASGKDISIGIAGPKSVLGTMSFLENDPRSATGRCKTEVKCVVINQMQREKLLKSIPSWFQVLVKDLGSNLRTIDTKYSKLAAEHEVLKKRFDLLQAKLKGQEEGSQEADSENVA